MFYAVDFNRKHFQIPRLSERYLFGKQFHVPGRVLFVYVHRVKIIRTSAGTVPGMLFVEYIVMVGSILVEFEPDRHIGSGVLRFRFAGVPVPIRTAGERKHFRCRARTGRSVQCQTGAQHRCRRKYYKYCFLYFISHSATYSNLCKNQINAFTAFSNRSANIGTTLTHINMRMS